ncbi:MAG: hypothetical protein K5840_02950, partial [Eubacterium sp.]|nr:hypothetical protein [Eubacterium sp.]
MTKKFLSVMLVMAMMVMCLGTGMQSVQAKTVKKGGAKLYVSKTSITVTEGDTVKFKVKGNKKITIKVKNSSVVKVSKTKLSKKKAKKKTAIKVTAKKAGTTKIIVKCGKAKIKIKVKVKADSSSSTSDNTSDNTSDDSTSDTSTGVDTSTEWGGTISTTLSQIDMSAWQYNSSNDVYYQYGISYCANPADSSYETMGLYVPGAYFDATANSDGTTYTCTVNTSGTVGNYTAETAPYVMPVNTPGYSAQSAPTGWSSDAVSYTNAGMIYLYAGCRGRNSGAPAGVTDLKAAIRYTRWCADSLPGNTDRIFSCGHSGGGAQSAILGASGDNTLYKPYLEAIGAIVGGGISDATMGAMCWCPITNLDSGNAAYEWNMGSTRTSSDQYGSDYATLSELYTEAYNEYIND